MTTVYILDIVDPQTPDDIERPFYLIGPFGDLDAAAAWADEHKTRLGDWWQTVTVSGDPTEVRVMRPEMLAALHVVS